MKVLVEAINMPPMWHLGGTTAELRLYANQSFMTSDGQWIPAGSINDPNSLYLPVACTIAGNIPLIPSFEIDSTIDALVNRTARWSAFLFSENKRYVPVLENFPINVLQTGDPSTTWGELMLLRDGLPPRLSLAQTFLAQVASLVSLAAGVLNRSSDTNTGVTALSVAPSDPQFPIAVGENDPLIQSLRAGIGLLDNRGRANLANGYALIPTSAVNPDSLIVATAMGPEIIGSLYVLRSEIIEDTSFVIRSTNEGDEGEVAWIMTQ